MIPLRVLPLLLLGVAGGTAQTTSNSAPVSVTVRSEADDVAQGFAQAFGRLSTGSPKNLTLVRDGQTRVLIGVKTVQAFRGVLAIGMDNGTVHLVNARDVIAVSDTAFPAPVHP
jgi:hypothetical protein